MEAGLKKLFAAVSAGLAASLAVGGTPVLAQDAPIVVRGPSYEAQIRRVTYRDLNLASYAGERQLVSRVNHAVREVCRDDDDHAYGLSQTNFYNCTIGAWRSAHPQMIGAVNRARQLAYRR